MITYLLLCILIIILLRYCIHYYKMLESVQNIQGSQSYPLIGDINLIKYRHDIMAYITRLCHRYNGIFKLWVGPRVLIVIADGEIVQKVLRSTEFTERTYFYSMFSTPLGLLGASHYAIWNKHRNIMNPAFKTSLLLKYMSTFNEKSENLTDDLHKYLDGRSFNLLDVTSKLVFSIVSSTLLGVERMKDEETNVLLEKITKLVELIGTRFCRVYLHAQFVYNLTNSYIKECEHKQYLVKFLDTIIAQKPAAYTNRTKDDITDDYQTMLDRMIDMQMTVDELRDECITILAAGVETSAIALTNVILLLAIHSGQQELLHQEIMSVCPSKDDLLDIDTLKSMTFLDLVYKETLRLFPSVPFVSRQAGQQPVNLGPCTVLAKGMILINFAAMHRKLDAWGMDANEFRPNRFADKNMDQRKNAHFAPFSYGPRNCIGYRYAPIFIKVALVHLLREYKFTTDLKLLDLKYTFAIKLVPDFDVSVKVEKRSG